MKAENVQKKSIGEFFSALCSAAGKNLAAVGGRHSFAEAMLLEALPFFRLICSFCDHDYYLLPGINPYVIALYPILLSDVNPFF